MVRTYKTKAGSKKRREIDPEKLEKALKLIREKKLSYRGAEKKFDIPKSVLYDKLKKNTKPKIGRRPVLSEETEKILAKNLIICAEWGYPMSIRDLQYIIKDYLDKNNINKFRNNKPGYDFIRNFIKRNRLSLAIKKCQNIKRKRAAVDATNINEYFDNLEKTLRNVPPDNIINYDETSLTDNPGTQKAIFKRSCKYPERVLNSSKSSISVMFACTASGNMLHPYVVYKAQHLYDSWTTHGAPGVRYNRSSSGWFDSTCFNDWVKTILIPYCRKKKGKKVVIGDNLACHISIEAISMCAEHDIHLVFLPPNSTHLTQPLDVAFFAPLKISWRQILTKWKTGDGKEATSLQKDKFPQLLKTLLEKIKGNSKKNIISGFRKCGIFPLCREKVLERLPLEPNLENESVSIDESFISILKELRPRGDTSSRPTRKKKLHIAPGASVSEVGPTPSTSTGTFTLSTKRKKPQTDEELSSE